MARTKPIFCLAQVAGAAMVALCASPVMAVTAVPPAPIIYGSLGNFDVINDTGQPCNGFEIELEGVQPGEVVYTFGDTGGPNPTKYIRYGKPTIVPNAAKTGSIVRYASPFDAIAKKFTETTPAAISPYPVTMGHQCWVFGSANYPGSGCEHFGISLISNPSKTSYRWLVGNSTTGLLSVVGSPGNPSIPAPVKVPPPVWNVVQPPPVNNVFPPPQVVAVVQAPPAPPIPPGGKGRWGEPIWMKIYKTELARAVELEDLLLGERGVVNPEDPNAEPPEIDWQLLQSSPIGKPPGAWEKSENGGAPGAGNESVSRRYEYYKYTGLTDTDADNLGEALCDNPTEPAQQVANKCGVPDTNGVAGVGDLIGAQNAAANLVPLCADDVTSSMSITRSGYSFNFGTGLYSQRVTLTNNGKGTVFGPLSLVLDGLNLGGSNGLFNQVNKTACAAPLSSPFIDAVGITSAAGLAPKASVSVLLQFRNTQRIGISYSPRVLSTVGAR